MRGILGIFNPIGEVRQRKGVQLGHERPAAADLAAAGSRPYREVA
jgi:hypothetical protein